MSSNKKPHSLNSKLLNNVKYKLHLKLHKTPPRNLNLPLSKEDIAKLSDYELNELKQKKLAGKFAFDITNKNIHLGSRHNIKEKTSDQEATSSREFISSNTKFYIPQIPKFSGESFYNELSNELAKRNIPISFQYGSGNGSDDIEQLLQGIESINIFDSNEEYNLLYESISASKPSHDLLVKATKRYNRYLSNIDLTEYPKLKKHILSFLQYDCLDSQNITTCFKLMKKIDSFIYNIVKDN